MTYMMYDMCTDIQQYRFSFVVFLHTLTSTPLSYLHRTLHHLPLCEAEVALMVRGSPFLHLSPFIFS